MRTDLPRGKVTFLVTDIEGSTRLLHQLGAEAYATALADHRRRIRAAFGTRRGIEVDTQGDAFLVAFGAAADAVDAAVAATADLASGPVRVRIGLHTGMPLLTDEGYVGEAVHVAARIAAAAHGGQVVMSAATRSDLEPGIAVTDLGEHRLKDIREPVTIFQVGPGAFPPLATISTTNLPRPASTFVGRRHELAAVLALIDGGARLITLSGSGGSGKTRLATEAAASRLRAFRAGVYWVSLAALRDASLVIDTVSKVLGARETLPDHIGERELLLVVDNLEQVIEAAPDLADLVERCPNLVVLVTSRERLDVRGEVEYAVQPMAGPDAVDLFCSRSGLAPSPTVAAICERLDDLPLAIELAAARSRTLPIDELLERLAGRLDLLSGGRDADPRQATLRATIDWSYGLLSPAEQRAFMSLAVFSGGCRLEAAEAVAQADPELLRSLADKSLVRLAGGRYRMFETVREYGLERLDQSGDGPELRARHAHWAASLVERSEPELEGGDQPAWLARLVAEHDEVRSALRWSIERSEADLALRLAGASATFWWIHGHWTEGRRWLEAALALEAPARPDRRAKALEAAAHLAMRQLDNVRARRLADEGLELYRAIDDPRGVGRVLRVLGLVASNEGKVDEFRTRTEESAACAREAGDDWALSMALNNLGYIALEGGETADAIDRFAAAISLARERGDQRSEAFFLENLALAALEAGRIDEARGAFEASLGLAWDLGFVEVEQTDLVGIAAIAGAAGGHAAAARMLGAAERLGERTGGALDPVEARTRARVLSILEAALEPDRLRDERMAGRELDPAALADVARRALRGDDGAAR